MVGFKPLFDYETIAQIEQTTVEGELRPRHLSMDGQDGPGKQDGQRKQDGPRKQNGQRKTKH